MKKANKIGQDVYLENSELGENVELGDWVRVVDSVVSSHVVIRRNSRIDKSRIGMGSYIGPNTAIYYNVMLGKFCSLSWNVSLIGANPHNFGAASTVAPKVWEHIFGTTTDSAIMTKGGVGVGNDVYIGAGASVLDGVTIGNGAVIGSGAVVTKDIPAYSVAVGNPAKVIKYRFSEKMIERLLQLEWWNLPLDIIAANEELLRIGELTEVKLTKLEEIKAALGGG